ncbi:MAG: hypothetical protein B7Y31_11170, partial [Novosphingobium sp. 16-62-11]
MKRLIPLAWTAFGAGLCAIAFYALSPTRTAPDADDKPAAPAVVASGGDPLKLDARALARAGVRVGALSASQASEQRTGFARALDVGALAAIDAEAKAAADAAVLADMLVWSHLTGRDGHGLSRIPWYVEMARNGEMNLSASLTVEREIPATLLLDGHFAAGPVAMVAATDL